MSQHTIPSQPTSNSDAFLANMQRAEQVDQLLRIFRPIDPKRAAQWEQNKYFHDGDYRPDLVATLERQVERAQYDAAIAADEKQMREAREAERLAAMPPLTDAERQEINAILPELMRLDPASAARWGDYVLRGWNRDTLDYLRKQISHFREVAAYFKHLRKQQQQERVDISDFDEDASDEALWA